ncbi:hypothetical protein HBI24_075170 [Parastagonospora nodorum]|nr:hypothetical protein HBH46_195190 [Parastagonospora nodorum]KAH5047365.1 hypothetical protein HBH96_227970 [Parastagonospora nodorum]KAH5586443.1 hypothetical protein HBI24_075170 [Parastagonospora nodorum]KAH5598870.1 hypothetical protein HBI45_155130 [Parastagonospora nodorum]KAH6295045.1 hypothetical protein HBI39_160710 [Parastagonospora nodorum]
MTRQTKQKPTIFKAILGLGTRSLSRASCQWRYLECRCQQSAGEQGGAEWFIPAYMVNLISAKACAHPGDDGVKSADAKWQ